MEVVLLVRRIFASAACLCVCIATDQPRAVHSTVVLAVAVGKLP